MQRQPIRQSIHNFTNGNFEEEASETLVWNVFTYYKYADQFVVINILKYPSPFLEHGLIYAAEHFGGDFRLFSDHIKRSVTMFADFVGDTMECSYPHNGTNFKLNISTQIMINWDKFVNYVWENKNRLTPMELGIE